MLKESNCKTNIIQADITTNIYQYKQHLHCTVAHLCHLPLITVHSGVKVKVMTFGGVHLQIHSVDTEQFHVKCDLSPQFSDVPGKSAV